MEKADLTSFAIQTEVKETQAAELGEFLYQRLVLPRKDSIANAQRTTFENEYTLSFRVLDPQGKWHFDTETKIGKTVKVKIAPSSDPSPPDQVLSQFKDDMFIAVGSFEDQTRRRTIYFAWGEGLKVTPGKSPFKRRRILSRILFENMIFLFMLLLVFSVFLFVGLEATGISIEYVPVLFIVIQFLIVLAAPKLISRGADWTITEQNPNVHILTYTVPPEEAQMLREKLNKDTLLKIKTEIYQNTLALRKPIDCQAAQEVFSKYGLTCVPENLSVKTVNVYKLVEEAARKFDLQVPKIVISNTIIPNAAATGPSPKLGMVLITTGILVQLQEDELLAVLGHEFSHLTGRDPVVLYGLISTEYLFRFYVVLPFLLGYNVLLFYLYFLVILGVIFFIAKFFEARADLVSAIRIGTPQVLAGALRKIGFRRLGLERSGSARVQSWIGFDPHPPIYFRVERLEKLQTPVRVRSPLLTSIKDCFRGFFASF
jgi:heat shock protein HtpX